MIFNLFKYIYLLMIFLLLSGSSTEIMFLSWYGVGVVLLSKLHSHISFMLLVLEMFSMISISLILMCLLKNLLELTFFFFLLCLLVGEACLGLSLMVMNSRFQKKELTSLCLV